MSRKHRKSPNPASRDLPVAESPVELAELIETSEDLETEKIVAAAVEKAVEITAVEITAVEITADDVLAIRRLRNSLIEKLFTPDRTVNSWTELKASN